MKQADSESGSPRGLAHARRAKEAVDGALAALREWELELQERERDLELSRKKLQEERLEVMATAERARKEAADETEALRAQLSRERADFDDERRRVHSDHAAPEDIISINMGGERTVQVKRSLLTQFEGSFLAAMFSGRWEEQITRDGKGNVFFDDPPEVMMPLIEWLREVRDATPDEPAEPPRVDPRFKKMWTRMMHRFGLEVEEEEHFKITDGSHPGTAWFWYRSSSPSVVFKYRLKSSESAWINFSRVATREGAWWRSCDWTRGNSSHEVSIWVDQECKNTCDGV